ncbi:ester cyclase [Natronorubrum halophilum]|uniref:ester cyclase n=1 Tax=Natronorubrum halophilum TaxID=1702106 RepID=UPI000EF6C016|nr:ester cyclase [Natronorubrum halophilum]
MTTEPKALVRRDPEEIWTAGNLDAIDELFADGFVLHDPSTDGESRGRDDYREYVETYRAAFPDVEYEVESIVAEGGIVALRYTAGGTHEGEFMGIAPTGERVSVSGMEQYRVEDGRIVEMWTSYDALGLFQQLGVVPPLEELGDGASPEA